MGYISKLRKQGSFPAINGQKKKSERRVGGKEK